MSDASSAFISYHHEDKIIGETLNDQLIFLAAHGDGRRFLNCFLDTREIQRGMAWKPIIDEKLGDSDWLVVIYTGKQSVYCGYEIGTFSHMHKLSSDKRVMGLYDVDEEKLPDILKETENTRVPPIDNVIDTKDVTVSANEVNTWYNSPIGKFLVDFCSYRNLYVQTHEKEEPGAYASNIALASKRIANAFALARGTDVKEETPSQPSFEITIKCIGDNRPEKIPGDTAVVGTSLFFDILDLGLPISWSQAPNTTWEKLQKLLKVDGKEAPWTYKVEADILRGIRGRTTSDEDVTLRGKNGKVYRPTLVRHQLFYNGDRKFYFVLAETLDRRFIGSPRSSLLLTALILASRWRFSYFEKWSDTNERKFGNIISLAEFADNCKQLIYNIEWIEHEGAELGSSEPRVMIEAFGQERRARVERFFDDWEKAKRQLFTNLPGIGTEITDENRASIQTAVFDFLRETRQQSAEFLELAVRAYSEYVISELETDRGS